MKTRILASIITGVLVTSAAQADTAFSTRDLDTIYSGMNPSFTRDLDISGYYTAPAQLQAAAAGNSTASVAQADSTSSIDVIYSGLNPSFTRNVDVSSYYTESAQLHLATEHKSTCNWRAVKNDINAPAAHTVSGSTDYFAPANLQLVC